VPNPPPALQFRAALEPDLEAIIALLSDDVFGAARNLSFAAEHTAYAAAFAELAGDPNNSIELALSEGQIVGCYQLTFIRGLSYTGGLRAQIESVRVARAYRGRGIGHAMMQQALAQAKARACALVQLTTDVRRDQTRQFYERLGFAATHHGMKIWL
jgi:ribosomal protein S18 acetylase RimI-like enzyme